MKYKDIRVGKICNKLDRRSRDTNIDNSWKHNTNYESYESEDLYNSMLKRQDNPKYRYNKLFPKHILLEYCYLIDRDLLWRSHLRTYNGEVLKKNCAHYVTNVDA